MIVPMPEGVNLPGNPGSDVIVRSANLLLKPPQPLAHLVYCSSVVHTCLIVHAIAGIDKLQLLVCMR